MIKCDKDKAKFEGTVPVLCAELACINVSMMSVLQEAGFTQDESIERVRWACEAGIEDALGTPKKAEKKDTEPKLPDEAMAVALNERLKAALAVADAGNDCRYCQHRNCMDDEPYRAACNAHDLDCTKCSTPCHCGKCESGSEWALDLEKLPEVRT